MKSGINQESFKIDIKQDFFIDNSKKAQIISKPISYYENKICRILKLKSWRYKIKLL